MKHILNWIIETYYPDRMFYGKRCNPFTTFKDGLLGKNEPVMLGALFLANYTADQNSTHAEYLVYGVSKSGEKRGDWVITVSRNDSIAELTGGKDE